MGRRAAVLYGCSWVESLPGSSHTVTSAVQTGESFSLPPVVSVVRCPTINMGTTALWEQGACTNGPSVVVTVAATLDPSMHSTVVSSHVLDVVVNTAHVHATEAKTLPD